MYTLLVFCLISKLKPQQLTKQWQTWLTCASPTPRIYNHTVLSHILNAWGFGVVLWQPAAVPRITFTFSYFYIQISDESKIPIHMFFLKFFCAFFNSKSTALTYLLSTINSLRLKFQVDSNSGEWITVLKQDIVRVIKGFDFTQLLWLPFLGCSFFDYQQEIIVNCL